MQFERSPATQLAGPNQHAFDPYTNNGGTSLAVAGEDFVLVGSDTRQSEGYNINSRYNPKAWALPNGCVLATAGFNADCQALYRTVLQRIELYVHNHQKQLSLEALAAMIHTILYSRRFFPLYSYTIVAGIDKEGKGRLYSYDAIGSYDSHNCACIGSGTSLIQPVLDNQIDKTNQPDAPKALPNRDFAVKLVKDCFTSATERDIYTGDYLELFLIDKDGIKKEKYDLKKD
ncbi:N-terminal nucleophile aminohydrolase [Conidiobolus coronatus NRRL 28638]|uniref:Proteasome subunit beta n=1 Tax=Conidiobolus coronatus (strain ATCC 28846 / CBS 209.66 / NRRL 28638) TaxID=796925 RepID=A0A137NR42_CONC2|nr:N-terminal nucleophile aminohydrolase [Conidiobolus coronatus NRRL 28638]|eukprot:KXN65205.1 N-terminal nucleophile aminohydrolase [Conidiobolus coronatus NRRL 28638]